MATRSIDVSALYANKLTRRDPMPANMRGGKKKKKNQRGGKPKSR